MQTKPPAREVFLCNLYRMKRIILLSVFCLALLNSEAQSKCSIYKANAYFTVSMPGTVMVDEQGNQVRPAPTVQRFIYLECIGTKRPVIQAITYNNIPFTPAMPESFPGSSILAGKRNEDEKEIMLKPRKGNRIWKIEILPPSDKPQSPEACRNIILKLKQGNNGTCSYRIISGELQLYAAPMY